MAVFTAFVVITGMVFPPRILDYGLDSPAPVGTYLNDIFPRETPSSSSSWTAVEAYPNLTFTDPIQLLEMPYSTKFMMAGKQGRLWTFEKNDTTTTGKTTILNIENKVLSGEDAGLLGVAFHPQFGQPGSPNRAYIYTFYRGYGPYLEDLLGYLVLSRWNYDFASGVVDPGSEYILIKQFDRNEWHNGGGMFFDPEGYLHLAIGDEGGAYDDLDNGQKINRGLFSGSLRIDVDRDTNRSHPIRRQPLNPGQPPAGWPNSFTQGYYIPNDNPWQSPDGLLLEEFFAIGLRSPHRMTLDTLTGDIWVGDVGQGTREEVSIVSKGSNLQWPYREGILDQSFIGELKPKPNPLIGTEKLPVYDYPRSEGNCIIGGFVYRGNKWNTVLEGKYIFGDHGQQTVWSLDYDVASGTSLVNYITTLPYFGEGNKSGISAFATDSVGEVYVLKLFGTNLDGGKIYKLIPQTISPEPPALLSETGAFSDLSSLSASEGMIPYTVNSPLWSDGADKKRWIALPNDGTFNSPDEQVTFSEKGNWNFPDGTVFVKHFEIPLDENNPTLVRRLETRFLIRKQGGGVYGITYKWNKEGTEATLLSGKDTIQYAITHSNGSISNRVWTIPSRANCLSCHNDNAENVLGLRTHQLNGELTYPSTGVSDNQLRTWNHLGIFSAPVTEVTITGFDKSVPLTDLSATPEHRVRSYLDANCAHCHQPNGVGTSFDARFSTPLNQQHLINGSLLGEYPITEAAVIKPRDPTRSVMFIRDKSVGFDAMPPLAKSVTDSAYISVLKEWILSLDPGCEPAPLSDSQINLHYTDSEELASDNPAVYAFDGDYNTFWHTDYIDTNPVHPHELQLDLGESLQITGFRYYPRQDGSPNGTIAEYEFYLSEDGTNWGSPVAAGDFATTGDEAAVNFAPQTARYTRLVALSEINGNPWTSVAELDILVKNRECISPGGVAGDLQLWLKGNSGISAGNTWDDLSNKGNHFRVIGGNPQHLSGKLNYNDVWEFDKADGEDALTMTGNLDIRSFFIVYNHTSKDEWETPFTNNHVDGIFHGDDTGDPDVFHDIWTPGKSKYGENYVNGSLTNLLEYPRPSSVELHSRILQNNETGVFTYYIGIDRNFFGRGMSGDIAEIISFRKALNLAERQRVETYLALQYGISLSHDYYASDWKGNTGTIVWDAGKGYDYRIAGIGKDSLATLDQRQSKGSGFVEIYHDNVQGLFPLNNSANNHPFPSDRSFLIWGDNNGAISALEKPLSDGAEKGVNRVWKVQNTGNVGTVTLRIPKNALPPGVSSLYINNHNETDFPTGPNTQVYTLTGGSDFLCTPVSFHDGDIFTFGNGKGEFFPVEWMDLRVIQEGENAQLEWVTTREEDNDYFAVERSFNGLNFIEIAQVKGAGTTDISQTYWHLDENIYRHRTDKIFYRIRQVDFDGEYALSHTAELNLLEKSSYLQMTLLPNPASDKAVAAIQTVKTEQILLDVFNPNGQLLYHARKSNPKAEEMIELPVYRWGPGIYYVKVSNGLQTTTDKLLVR
ncbi:MAG: discoidin domain-containing protein [Bacteroidia bacterium]|nr:discoidin domain-containing protein [Bacteroidia bacterium]